MIGQTVSHYKIVEKLGQGGMGVVYKAEDTSLDRMVALKFLPPHLAASAQDKARFRQEAKAAAALNHPNVCSIIEIGEHEGMTFIVMEYVDGRTLGELKGTVSFRQAIEIGIQVADGLAAAHEKGIVHRDIKPDNIMLRKDGIAQIMDFGLAKLRTNDSKISRLTKEGSTVGTAGYMSPEQVQGFDTDHRSDIFSYGVLLYELLAGQLPFRGAHEMALAYEIVNVDPPPMSVVKPGIDPALDAIVLECLEKEPRERTQSIAQTSLDLKRYKRESTKQRMSRTVAARQFPARTESGNSAVRSGVYDVPENVQQPTARSYKQYLLPAVCVALVAALAWTSFQLTRTKASTALSPGHFSINFPPEAKYAGGSDGIAISPDGKMFAYTGLLPNAAQLFIRKIGETTVTAIPGTEGCDEPTFSPDGEWIVFDQGDKIMKVSISGGAPQTLCAAQGFPRGLCWGQDNMIYFGHITKGLQRIPPSGGTPERITTLDSTQVEISHRYPQLLPGGKSILFTIKPGNIATFDDALVAVERMDTHERKIVIHGGTYARYTPNGYLVYVRGKSIYAIKFDVEKLETQGTAVAIMDGGWDNMASGSAAYTFSNAGTMVYATNEPVSFNTVGISWMDRQGKLTPLLDTLRAYNWGSLSPDGENLVLDISAANDDVWLYQIKRGILSRVTFGGGNSNFPTWGSEGKYIYFASEKGHALNLFRKAWDGSGQEERLTRSDSAQIPYSVSPDGSTLAFTQNGDIWMLGLGNDKTVKPFIQSPAFEDFPSFSRNGRWLAYSSTESGKPEVYVVQYPNKEGKWQISNGGGTVPQWSRDAKKLFYVGGTTLMEVEIAQGDKFDFALPKKVCDVPANVAGFGDLALDGQRFIIGTAAGQTLVAPTLDVVVNWFDFLDQSVSRKQ